ncbi:cobalamin B12-binding domain-containing protein [Peteryoungia desertarenae]|uniref:Cobalamin B12-binding domain-containing protein n=2 Tax=Peteryoungia desertarenae TaxID=1813451 RepID=A0ABX6QRR3_9HYPH|nr:cobalamin B12-binding domain-containing protein [Peteryoungia desertarenae]
MVGAGHPELTARPDAKDIPEEFDLRLHPELDPVARQMPGTEKATRYRAALIRSLIDADPRSHRDLMEELQRSDVPMQTLAIQLFAPVAARLGNLWCTDEADFMQIAVASTRLGMIINHLSHTSAKLVKERRPDRRLLLARTRGTMHTIGVSIVATCFRDMGWEVDGGVELEVDDSLYEKLLKARYQLLGISVGQVSDATQCSDAIRRIHASPMTRRTKVAIGGPAVRLQPETFKSLGADIVAQSALEVMQMADAMHY